VAFRQQVEICDFIEHIFYPRDDVLKVCCRTERLNDEIKRWTYRRRFMKKAGKFRAIEKSLPMGISACKGLFL